jgi:hypothetical protein
VPRCVELISAQPVAVNASANALIANFFMLLPD